MYDGNLRTWLMAADSDIAEYVMFWLENKVNMG